MLQNHVVLKIQKGAQINQIIEVLNAAVIDTISGRSTFLVYYSDPLPVDTVIEMLQGDPNVVYAQPDYLCSIPEIDQISQSFPDENRPVYVTGVSPEPYYDQSGTVNIYADSAHLLTTGAGVIVAVIDNGIDYTHPLFENSLIAGYDFIDSDDNPTEESGTLLGHGTFVSGIIKRVAPDCMVMPLRAFDGEGYGSSFNVAEAIYLAIDNGADVINMSFSMTVPDPVVDDAVMGAINANIAMAAAPGNNGQMMVTYPAAFSGVIAVSAIDNLDYLAAFSNYGEYIDVCAPGVNIYSALAGEYQWGTWSGTSFSTPIISGICALLLSLDSNLNSYSIRNLIRTTATTDLYWGTIETNDPQYGWGRVNAFSAVWELVVGEVDMLRGTNILDISYLTRFVFQNGPQPQPEPIRGDVNLSGGIDSLDVDSLINRLYRNGNGSPQN